MRRGNRNSGMAATYNRKRGIIMNTNLITNQANNNWYSVKEMCELCSTSRQTWVNFKNDPNCKIDFTVKRNLRRGDKNVDYYNEEVLKQFQAWLMKNQANQGKSSQVVKQATEEAIKFDLAVKAINQTGDVEAMKQLCDVLMDNVKKQNQILVLEQEKTKLVVYNNQLREENKLLTEGYDATSKQLSYYRKKYHSWQDDYENY